MTGPALNSDLGDLIADLLARMQHVLGDQLLGLYLYGSLVAGDFDPDISDIDTLAVLRSALTDNELEALRAMHDAFAADYPAWDGRIEVAYVPARALRTFRSQESTIAAISPGEPFHAKQAGREWLMNWWIVREQGVTLHGPPPETFIDPISRAEFLENVQLHARLWLGWASENRELPAQGYMIVTGCRALYAVHHGQQASKKQAVAWAQERYPEWAGCIGDAFAWRGVAGREGFDPQATYPKTLCFLRFVETVINSEGPGS